VSQHWKTESSSDNLPFTTAKNRSTHARTVFRS